ncbi:MAG TPA: hypothetical protein ENK14_12660 [Caldithrix sp.]|nr:hypothetical protein [Caldithrix sp.]
MKNAIFLIIVFFLLVGSLSAENFQWEVITNFNNANDVLVNGDTLFAATPGGLLIYSLSSGEYDTWTTEDGISTQSFSTVIQTHKGLLVLGTQTGALSFINPVTRFYSEDFSLSGNEITGLAAIEDTLWVSSKKMVAVYLFDPEKEVFTFRDFFTNYSHEFNSFQDIYYFKKRIWVASDKGLFSAPGDFLRYNLKSADNWNWLSSADGLPSDNVISLNSFIDTLLIGTINGISKYDLQSFRNSQSGLSSRKIYHIKVKNNKIYVDNLLSIYQMNGNQFNEVAKIAPRIINDFAVDNQEHILVAIKDKGLLKLPDDERIWINGPTDNSLGNILLDSQGRLWVSAGSFGDQRQKGFSVRFKDGTWHNYRYIKNWRNSANSQSIIEDTGGNIWIGSWNGGLLVIDKNFNFYNFNNFTAPGDLWITSPTEDDTVQYAPPDSVRHFFSYTRGWPNLLVITDFLLDPLRQSIWIAALTVQSGRPIIRYKQTAFGQDAFDSLSYERIAFPDYIDIINDQITDLTFDISHNLWIGTQNSGAVALQYDQDGTMNWLWINETNNLKNNSCWAVAGDQDGYVWLGTNGGLNAYFNGQVVDFREDYQPIGLWINQITVDSENNKWFATDKGLSLLKASGSPWDPKSWVHFVPKNSEFFGDNIYRTNLPSENIRSVFVDNHTGDVYCGTSSGLAILRSNPFTTPLPDLNKVKVGPNPLILGGKENSYLYFRNLTGNSQIKILTTTGRLVKTLGGGANGDILGSFAQWDGRNEDGRLVSSGVYLYMVSDENGNSNAGKFVVIRK